MSMSVTVLCPNGRRVNVKVTPNTSILQIIEDACKKEKFDPDEYDLKNLQRTLDTSSTVRYSNVPNKSQLELIKCAVPRTASNVTVNIATDSGLRLVHDFPANTTLWDILSHHQKEGNDSSLIPPEDEDKEAAIVYTMRRISGSQLKTTTLKSLGLTGGKCMLRHSIQKSSSSGQAHVSAPLSRPKAPREENNVQHQQPQPPPPQQQQQQQPPPQRQQPQPLPQPSVSSRNDLVPNLLQQIRVDHPPSVQQLNPLQEPVPDIQLNHSGPPADIAVAERPDVVSSSRSVPDVIQQQNGISQPDIVTDNGNTSHLPMPMDILEGHEGASSSSNCLPEPQQQEEEPMQQENIIKLGSHDAILFNMDDVPPSDLSIDDDSFFQLTVSEVKSLHREHMNVLRSMDDAPLMTKQMRDMHESAKVLSALNQFPVTQLRIYFPDNNVIQGSFKPLATVQTVIDFLRPYLHDPNTEFSLTLRHPPKTLSSEQTLVDADCVPNARLYFTSTLTAPYLSDDTLSKMSSFRSACSSLKTKSSRRPFSTIASTDDGVGAPSGHVLGNAVGVTVNEGSFPKRTNTNMQRTGAVKKVPKWFKTGK